ncbi:hypothetical protein ACA910_014425 [Epithemia clementina (nom. ined.)]
MADGEVGWRDHTGCGETKEEAQSTQVRIPQWETNQSDPCSPISNDCLNATQRARDWLDWRHHQGFGTPGYRAEEQAEDDDHHHSNILDDAEKLIADEKEV